ncbi:MAG: hypothetical protein AB1752_14715, partial [Candidatus Zixiibacteriota bacterium]
RRLRVHGGEAEGVAVEVAGAEVVLVEDVVTVVLLAGVAVLGVNRGDLRGAQGAVGMIIKPGLDRTGGIDNDPGRAEVVGEEVVEFAVVNAVVFVDSDLLFPGVDEVALADTVDVLAEKPSIAGVEEAAIARPPPAEGLCQVPSRNGQPHPCLS